MKNIKLIVILISIATISSVVSYGVTKESIEKQINHFSGLTEASAVALECFTGKPFKNKIIQVDQMFLSAYMDQCSELCKQRIKVSTLLKTASIDDQVLKEVVSKVHYHMAEMEKMTLNHIITIRDLLPDEATKQLYIAKIQEKIEKNQALMLCGKDKCTYGSHLSGKETK